MNRRPQRRRPPAPSGWRPIKPSVRPRRRLRAARLLWAWRARRTRPTGGSASNYEGLGDAVRQLLTRALLYNLAGRAPRTATLPLRHYDDAAATTATSSPQRLLSSLLTSRAHRHHRRLLLPPVLLIELLYESVACLGLMVAMSILTAINLVMIIANKPTTDFIVSQLQTECRQQH